MGRVCEKHQRFVQDGEECAYCEAPISGVDTHTPGAWSLPEISRENVLIRAPTERAAGHQPRPTSAPADQNAPLQRRVERGGLMVIVDEAASVFGALSAGMRDTVIGRVQARRSRECRRLYVAPSTFRALCDKLHFTPTAPDLHLLLLDDSELVVGIFGYPDQPVEKTLLHLISLVAGL